MKQKKLAPRTWSLLLLLLTLTGFGQMPIFKRYYIADVPGLGWLARFDVTHYLHYAGAILFVALAFYKAGDYVAQRDKMKLSGLGYFRGLLLGGIILSGFVLIIKNFPGYRFSGTFITLTDLTHLGLVMIFLFSGSAAFFLKWGWTKREESFNCHKG